MSLFKNFGTGFGAYGKAINMLFSKELWWFLLFPIALNVLVMVASWLGIVSIADAAESWTKATLQFDDDSFFLAEYIQSSSGFISSAIGWTIWLMSKFLFWILYGLFGGYIIIMLMSPVFAILSEKTEEMLTGNKYPFNAEQMMRDVVRGILIAFRNMFIEFGYMIVIYVLGFFVPIIGGIVGTIMLFFLASYFYGFAFIDYTNERRRMTLKQSVAFMRTNKGLVIGNGIVFSTAMFFPFCGTFIAGFVAILSIIAATIATHKVVDLSSNTYARHKKETVVKVDDKNIEGNTRALDEGKEG